MSDIKTDNSQTLVNALEEIEALKLANRDLQHWFDDARDEAERLQRQVEKISSAAWSYMKAAQDPANRVFYRMALEDAIAEAGGSND